MKTTSLLLFVCALGLGGTILFGQVRESGAETDAQTTYFASGQLESRVQYEDGRREGLAQRFYADGAKQSEGSFAAGLMEGEWHFWNTDGSIDAGRTGTYHAGDRIPPESSGVGN